MEGLDLELVTAENAEIWCLRVSLWQHNHKLVDVKEEDDDPQILQLEEDSEPVYRGKRGARKIRRRIAPREDMTQPPTGFRVRQEYRTLSLAQRRRFHDALNVLHDVSCRYLVDIHNYFNVSIFLLYKKFKG